MFLLKTLLHSLRTSSFLAQKNTKMKNPCNELKMQNSNLNVNLRSSTAIRPKNHVQPNKMEKITAILALDLPVIVFPAAIPDFRPKANIVVNRTMKFASKIKLIGDTYAR